MMAVAHAEVAGVPAVNAADVVVKNCTVYGVAIGGNGIMAKES